MHFFYRKNTDALEFICNHTLLILPWQKLEIWPIFKIHFFQIFKGKLKLKKSNLFKT